MKLYYTDWSPYVRKVRIAAIERGLHSSIELVPATIGFAEGTLKTTNSELTTLNPSGRVPTLITDDGDAIFDSTVIIHYLDGIGNANPIIPSDYDSRIKALRLNALVDEVIDAMRHLSFEGKRPEDLRLPDYIDALNSKINRGLSILENEAREFKSPVGPIDIGIISVGCLMQSIKIRHSNVVDPASDAIFNRKRNNLDSWINELIKRESMEKTKPPPI